MPAALSIRGMSKSFGGQRALADLDLDLDAGEIRALVGQNGCGKSTLIKILAGFHEPDPGAVVHVGGAELALAHPGAAEAAGLRFVHQDLGLVGSLDTLDNLALGRGYSARRGRPIRWRDEQAQARAAIEALGYDFDVRAPVATLTMSERTAIAVARATSPRTSAARVLILDEPTANLPAVEIERLFSLVRKVRDSGVAVLFVSHHLDEVFSLADSVTVVRDGRHIATGAVAGFDEARLIEAMIGRRIDEEDLTAHGAPAGDVALAATGLAGGVLAGIDLQVRGGEVLGVAGITGSGREELAMLLFGGAPRTGEVTVGGRPLPPSRPDRSIAAGLGLVPAERHANATLLDACVRENVTLLNPGSAMVRGVLRKGREQADVATWLHRLDVRPASTELAMSALSGGNQQKVVLARWLRHGPRALILDEPTQGVDVGVKSQIHDLVEAAAQGGAAVLVISTDSEELARLCSRVLVLRSGRIAAQLRGPAIHADAITAATIGSGQSSAA